MKTATAKLSLLAVIVLLATQAACWGSFGHILTARIAETILKAESPKALAKAYAKLGSLNKFFRESENSLLEASVIPDYLNFDFSGFLKYYHYVDVPTTYKNEERPLQLPEDFPFGAAYGISAMTAIIRDSLDEGKRAKAVVRNGLMDSLMLRYLIHVTGDLHQPLHSTSMFSNLVQGGAIKEGDAGGNKIIVTDLHGSNPRPNLHSLWDSAVGLYGEFRDFPLSSESVAVVDAEVGRLMAKFPKAYFGGLADVLVAQTWIDESHELAVNFVYNDIDVFPILRPEYVANGREICEERIALAGYRIAAVLKDLFK